MYEYVGVNFGRLGRCFGHLGGSWGHLGWSWGALGALLGGLELSWGALGGRLTDQRILNPTDGKIVPGQVSVFSSNLAPQKGAKTTPRRPKINQKIVLKNDWFLDRS